MYMAELSCCTSSSLLDKEPSSTLLLDCRFRQNAVEYRVEQTPKARAHLVVALCNLCPPHVEYLASKLALQWSIHMGHIVKPLAVSSIHHVAYMSCVRATKLAGQS